MTATDLPHFDEARTHLQSVLDAMAPAGSVPRDDQTTAVAALLEPGARVLVVQATGWGKSAVYWAATRATRGRGAGCTLVVSPLLALMRDQVAAAERAGMTAATINSSNIDEWDLVMDQLREDQLDVLLVSPERLANPRFESQLDTLLSRCGLLVVDEAHCISDWGFDFRPDYQRLSAALLRLGGQTPVLATTATANQRVTEDVARQLGEDTLTLRGTLARASLDLSVVQGLNAVERYAWVSDALGQIPGSGIVYCLTVAETEKVAGFLTAQGHKVEPYSGALHADTRAHVEEQLRRNELKAVVATSALGMGYDKPDLAFCIHVGSPSSPVAYYQQVGRAGRAIDKAVAVLLPAETDERLWAWFATASIPDPVQVNRVMAALREDEPQSVVALEGATAVRRGRLESMLKLLAVDGAVTRKGQGWVSTGEEWTYNDARWEMLKDVREAEADIMRKYAHGKGCLMEFLQLSLDDPDPRPCGRCSVCTGELPGPGARPAQEAVVSAQQFVRGSDVVVEARKRWPGGVSRKGNIAGCTDGRALAFADDAGWSAEIARCVNGPWSDEITKGVVQVLVRWKRHWKERPVAVVPLPDPSAPGRVERLCEEIAKVGKMPLLELVERDGPPPGSDLASGAHVAAVEQSVVLSADAAEQLRSIYGPVLLVADNYRSGWTATVAGALLREAGATAVMPLVVHQLP